MGQRRSSTGRNTSKRRSHNGSDSIGVKSPIASRKKAVGISTLAASAKVPLKAHPIPAQCAREAAGITLETAAKKLRLHTRYVRQLERSGTAPLHVAAKMAKLYQCSGNLFLFPPSYFAARPPSGVTTEGSDARRKISVETGVACSDRRRHTPRKTPAINLISGGKLPDSQ